MIIELNEEQILDAFVELLQIPSFSQYERDVASYIKHRCHELHIDVMEDQTTHTTGSNVGNLLCHIPGNSPHIQPIFFTAHMDTIEKNSVTPIIESGYVKTNGTTALGADDKVGIIALLEAVHYLKTTNQAHGDIQLIFTVCEEQGLVGAKSFNKHLITGNFGYTVDADEPVGTLVTKSPAIMVVTITIFSKQDNVHEAISSVIQSIYKQPKDKDIRVSVHGFQKNNQENYDAIDVTIELTSFFKKHIHSYILFLKHTTERIVRLRQMTFIMDVQSVCSNYTYRKDEDIVRIPTEAGKEIDLPISYVKRQEVSDANVFTSTNRPTMNIGVGYEGIHTTDEQIPISEIYALTRFIIAIALSAANE